MISVNKEEQKSKATTGLLVKSSFWYTLSGFLSKAMVFLTTPLFTRLLTKEQYGDFTVFASWQAIMLVVCGLETYATINKARFDFQAEKDFNAYISSSLILSTAFTALTLILYFIFPASFQRIFLLDKKYMVFMFMYIFTYPAFGMFQAKQRIEYKYKLSALISFILVIASSGLSILFAVMFDGDHLWGRVVGQYGLYIVTGIFFYLYFLRRDASIRICYMKYALRLAIPFVFSYLGSAVLLSSDNLVVKHMCSGEEVSHLSLTHTCANIILILVQLLNNAWSPWFYDKLNEKEYETIRRTFKAYVWLVVLGTFTVLLFTPEIITILGGKGYSEAIYIVPVNIMNGFFSVLTYQFGSLETFYKKPEYSAIITSCIAITNVILDIIGVKIWGYRTVCYATLICQVLLVCIHYQCTKKMDIEKMLTRTDMFIFITVLISLIPLSLLFYSSDILRWLLIGILVIVFCTVIIVKRKQIHVIARQFRNSN